jgi:hypothetical protein
MMGRIDWVELLARLNQAFTPRYNGRDLTIRCRHESGPPVAWTGAVSKAGRLAASRSRIPQRFHFFCQVGLSHVNCR